MHGFLKARRSWEPGSSLTTIEFSFICLLWKVSAVNVCWTEQDSYLSSSQKCSSWNFLALAKLNSTARVWNHQRISKLVNRIDCCLSYDSFLALRSKAIVRTFLTTNALQRDSNVPMPYMAFVACLMTALSRFAPAIVQTFLTTNASQRDFHCA